MAQSGGLGFGIMNQGLARGIDFSYVISTGNETDLGVVDYVEYLIADEHTRVIGLFLEGLDEPLRLRDLALRAAAAGKAIVAAKMGRSPEAQQAAVSHTGHIAGPSRLWSALFRQAGIVEVTDIAEFLDVLAVLARFQAAGGNRAAVITVSGGAGTWMTDALRQFNVAVPELAASIQDQLRPLLPYYAGLRNPVDITAGAGRPGGRRPRPAARGPRRRHRRGGDDHLPDERRAGPGKRRAAGPGGSRARQTADRLLLHPARRRRYRRFR